MSDSASTFTNQEKRPPRDSFWVVGFPLLLSGLLFVYLIFAFTKEVHKKSKGFRLIAGIGEEVSAPTGAYENGHPANEAYLYVPEGVAVDRKGNVYIADSENHRIRKVTPNGFIYNIAGTGKPGYTGEGIRGKYSRLNRPLDLMAEADGSLLIADTENHRIRRLSPNGILSTVAGTGKAGFAGDNGAAKRSMLREPMDVAEDASGNLYVADTRNHRIRRINLRGIIMTVAGTGRPGFGGDGKSATHAMLNTPEAVAVDRKGTLYIADTGNARIRSVRRDGIIRTVAGSHPQGFWRSFWLRRTLGDGHPATQALLRHPHDVIVDAKGTLFIADRDESRIRKVTPDGIIHTAVGRIRWFRLPFSEIFDNDSYDPNNWLDQPRGIAMDAWGNLLIADANSNRVRKALSRGSPGLIAGRPLNPKRK